MMSLQPLILKKKKKKKKNCTIHSGFIILNVRFTLSMDVSTITKSLANYIDQTSTLDLGRYILLRSVCLITKGIYGSLAFTCAFCH